MMQDLSQPDITNEDVKDRETQIARICRMEEILDKSGKAVRDLQEALERYIALEEEIRELELYYAGRQWQKILPTMRQANFPGFKTRRIVGRRRVRLSGFAGRSDLRKYKELL